MKCQCATSVRGILHNLLQILMLVAALVAALGVKLENVIVISVPEPTSLRSTVRALLHDS
jgi:hypothetical protein